MISELRQALRTNPDEFMISYPHRVWLPTWNLRTRTVIHVQSLWRTHVVALCNPTIELTDYGHWGELPECKPCIRILWHHDLWDGPKPDISRSLVIPDALMAHELDSINVDPIMGYANYICTCGHVGWARRATMQGKTEKTMARRMRHNFEKHVDDVYKRLEELDG